MNAGGTPGGVTGGILGLNGGLGGGGGGQGLHPAVWPADGVGDLLGPGHGDRGRQGKKYAAKQKQGGGGVFPDHLWIRPSLRRGADDGGPGGDPGRVLGGGGDP